MTADAEPGAARDFIAVPVGGGWQVYDTVTRRHVGRVWRVRRYALESLDDLYRTHRPPIVRFILTGSTSPTPTTEAR